MLAQFKKFSIIIPISSIRNLINLTLRITRVPRVKREAQLPGMALHQVRRFGRFSFGLVGETSPRESRDELLTLYRIRSPRKVSTHLLAIRSRDESFSLSYCRIPFYAGVSSI